jgi:hypothetical protein
MSGERQRRLVEEFLEDVGPDGADGKAAAARDKGG